ncbi:MAG TPA: hypothetical protein VKA55_06045 [Gammaproteobacteria bacterium]|nr:hypothetical protein [Gammaproteobacteria bacterium]
MATANLLLHIHAHPDPRAAEQLSGALRDIPGVLDARHNPRRDNLFLVDFEPGAVAPRAVLEAARRAGYPGDLIGL